MFGLLKKKLSSFVKSITNKVEKSEPQPEPQPEQQDTSSKPQETVEQAKPEPQVESHDQSQPGHETEQPQPPDSDDVKPVEEPPKPEEDTVSTISSVEPEEEEVPVPATLEPTPLPEEEQAEPLQPKPSEGSYDLQPKPELHPLPQEEESIPEPEVRPKEVPQPEREVDSVPREEGVKLRLGLTDRLKSIITGRVKITEKQLEPLLEEFEISLLEGDVAFDVAERIVNDIREQLVDKEVSSKELNHFVQESIRQALLDVLSSDKRFNPVVRIKELVEEGRTPVKVIFVGPNGAGKTTTIAKLAHLLRREGLSVVLSASDTFRAAAIEQLVEHANRLDVPIIKGKYGADPTSVAYDAVNYARAHKIDVVLIDTAGRQDTSRNLLDQLKKMKRVLQPDLVLYVGESLVGNAIVDQVNSFNQAIPLDGVILTKLDCDVKGGSALSVTYATGVPVVMIGVGQGYDDLIPFIPEEIVNNLLS